MTLAEMQTELAELKTARSKILRAQTTSIGDSRVDRVQFSQIEAAISALEIRIARLQAGGGRALSHGVAVFGGRR